MHDYAFWRDADRLIRIALDEDLPARDVTTAALDLEDRRTEAVFMTREPCVVSGLAVAGRVCALVDPALDFALEHRDGEHVPAGAALARVAGPAAAILAGERTALNFLQRLSGVATATRALVDQVAGLPVAVLDTRKTTPGWRLLEKAAVRHGGGLNHRYSLSDAILIKDNHARICGGVGEAVARARTRLSPGTRIEVEAESLEEVRAALAAGAHVILLDNASPAMALEAARIIAGRAALELSGGITVGNVRAMAESGANAVSCGALTHSARAIDIGLEFS